MTIEGYFVGALLPNELKDVRGNVVTDAEFKWSKDGVETDSISADGAYTLTITIPCDSNDDANVYSGLNNTTTPPTGATNLLTYEIPELTTSSTLTDNSTSDADTVKIYYGGLTGEGSTIPTIAKPTTVVTGATIGDFPWPDTTDTESATLVETSVILGARLTAGADYANVNFALDYEPLTAPSWTAEGERLQYYALPVSLYNANAITHDKTARAEIPILVGDLNQVLEIDVTRVIAQISATVPLVVLATVNLNGTDGPIDFPDEYKIESSSAFPLELIDVVGTHEAESVITLKKSGEVNSAINQYSLTLFDDSFDVADQPETFTAVDISANDELPIDMKLRVSRMTFFTGSKSMTSATAISQRADMGLYLANIKYVVGIKS